MPRCTSAIDTVAGDQGPYDGDQGPYDAGDQGPYDLPASLGAQERTGRPGAGGEAHCYCIATEEFNYGCHNNSARDDSNLTVWRGV